MGLGSGITALSTLFYRKGRRRKFAAGCVGMGDRDAGALFNLYQPFWVNPPHITGTLVASVSTVVLFGTIIPFGMLMHATKFALQTWSALWTRCSQS